MDPFVFHTPTKITFGQGIAGSVCDIMPQGEEARILVVTDNQLLKTDLVKNLIAQWKSEKCVSVFSDVHPEAHLSGVYDALKLAKNEKCNYIIALGGGSVMDTAKATNIVLSLGGDILEHQGMNNLPGRLLPLIAMPTTTGTGAEVSLVAMIKDGKEGKKLLFASPYLAPEHAYLDPELTITLPPRLTAATGLDAITHCIEALVVEGTSSPITDGLALEALKGLFGYLPLAKKDGKDIEARSQTLVASTMAGMAFSSCGVGIIHALSHAIGGQFATHHGMTNAVLLPHGMRFNLGFAAERYADTARFLKISQDSNDEKAALALIKAVEQLITDMDLPTNLRGLSVPKLSKEKLDQLVDLASSDPAMIFNTRQASPEDIVKIYEDAY